MKIRVTRRIAEEWMSRNIAEVVPGLERYWPFKGVLEVDVTLAQQILADAKFNADARSGPQHMPVFVRAAYISFAESLADKIEKELHKT